MIRKLFGALLILSVALVILGFLLPGSVKVERTVTMQHPEHLIFDVLQDMRHFPEWAPWLVDRPQTAWRLEGPATGAGATLVWRETPQSDESRMWIVETQSPRWVGMKMDLAGNEFDTWYEIARGIEGQQVTWGMTARFGPVDLVGRYVGLALPYLVGRQYQKGLESLNNYLARTPGQRPPVPDRREHGET